MSIFNLSIKRKKLILELNKEITIDHLLPVKEELNSIFFILDDDEIWEYKKLEKSWIAVVKIRLEDAEEVLKFTNENKKDLVLDSIDQTFLVDLTRVYQVEIERTKEQDLKDMDKEQLSIQIKTQILKQIKETIVSLNNLAEIMGDIF